MAKLDKWAIKWKVRILVVQARNKARRCLNRNRAKLAVMPRSCSLRGG